MQKMILVLALVMMMLSSTTQIEIPVIQLTSDTVVGNILYEPLTLMSLVVVVFASFLMI